MAYQMAFLLAIGAYIGIKLDDYFKTKSPYFTAVCVLLFLIIAFYLTLKDIIFKKKD